MLIAGAGRSGTTPTEQSRSWTAMGTTTSSCASSTRRRARTGRRRPVAAADLAAAAEQCRTACCTQSLGRAAASLRQTQRVAIVGFCRGTAKLGCGAVPVKLGEQTCSAATRRRTKGWKFCQTFHLQAWLARSVQVHDHGASRRAVRCSGRCQGWLTLCNQLCVLTTDS